jgi:hypothetical protein
MEGEPIVFTHEIEPTHGVRILASGEIDDSVIDALELYIQLQKKRLDRERAKAVNRTNETPPRSRARACLDSLRHPSA